MFLNFDQSDAVQPHRFNRLGALYILALSIIATVAVIGQALIQSHLGDQRSDSRVVNVAGKQRMLSQKIAKTVLHLEAAQTAAVRTEIRRGLESTVHLWRVSQEGLQHGNDSLHLPGENSAAIVRLFGAVDTPYQIMQQHVLDILQQLRVSPLVSYDSLRPAVAAISQQEGFFLEGMERIVLQYEEEANHKIASLSRIEYITLAIVLAVIALELVFIFRPTTAYVSSTLRKLMASERNARKLSKEIGELYASLEKSYEQLSVVNEPPESPRLLAKADRGGNITFLTEAFAAQNDRADGAGLRVSDLFNSLRDSDDWMDDLIEILSDGNVWQGELSCVAPDHTTHWMDITIMPVYQGQEDIESLLVLGTDITLRKHAERSMKQKNKAEIENKINQQKFRSVLILEGQEEERKRLAMDIHDGIGQMLTSLNFQIGSINLAEKEKATQKVGEIDHLVKDIIKEVRRVTFNLKPTVLGDYGLQAALKVFVQEIGKLTTMKLTYTSEGMVERLPQNAENNIFRIIQEAINNAIKYSGSPQIDIALWQVGAELYVSVKDGGKGFDARALQDRTIDIESGRGLFNMYERTEYVHGKLEIVSEPGHGTTVLLCVPLRVKVMA